MVYLVLKTSQLNPLSYLNNSVSVNAKAGKSSYIPKDLIIRKRAFICYRSTFFAEKVIEQVCFV